MISKLVFSLIFLAGLGGVKAQELLVPLYDNPQKSASLARIKATEYSKVTRLELPVRDDFSYNGPYPDPSIWDDQNVLINTSFAVHSKTWGVATFDALDNQGKIYEQAENNPNQFVADHLTSKPINLSGLLPIDSVLLTFYFQPQGMGMDPRERDSLVVEFFAGIDEFGQEEWRSMWRAPGQTLLEFAANQHPYFHRVAIFVEDPIFFNDNFRFRFKNYASFPAGTTKNPPNLAGNYGIWNVDYVLLDKNRSVENTSYHDIAFATGAKPFIKPYTSMPWMHFIENPSQFLKNNLENKIANLGEQEYNYSYIHFLKNEQGTNLGFYDGGSWNILPFSEHGYETYPTFANPVFHLASSIPLSPANKREFTIMHAIREGTAGDSYTRNDTTFFKQVFDNHYAYDYGVPTSGYGIDQGAKPRGALKFELAKEDDLKAVQIFINRTYKDDNNIPFRITVWKNLDPTEIVYQSEILMPEFLDELNGFYTHFLETPVTVSGTIYVGWQQESAGWMNVGWDFNVANQSDIVFYSTANQWFPSIYTGTLMIRPFFGDLGNLSTQQEPKDSFPLKLFPNPLVGNTLNIDPGTIENEMNLSLEVFDMFGRLIHSGHFSRTLDLSGVASGVYIVRVVNRTSGQVSKSRLVVAR